MYSRAARIRRPDSLMERRFQAMLLAGEAASAARLAQGWLAASPASAAAQRANAWVAAGSNNWPTAQRLYAILAAGGRDRDLRLLSDLALVQAKTGDIEGAVLTAGRAQSLYRAHPMSAQALGVVLVASGEQRRDAASLLAKARNVAGDNPLLAEARMVLAATR